MSQSGQTNNFMGQDDGARSLCAGVSVLVEEMSNVAGGKAALRERDRRRTLCHVRQIAMYVCHVVLRLKLTDIGYAFGRDRTTVAHACKVIEDRRDDTAYDEFVSAVERAVAAMAPQDRQAA